MTRASLPRSAPGHRFFRGRPCLRGKSSTGKRVSRDHAQIGGEWFSGASGGLAGYTITSPRAPTHRPVALPSAIPR